MANTNERKLGPDEVDQGINANDIMDATDDIPETRPTPTKEITEKDLDRGEELYTGFGFGNTKIDTTSKISEPIQTQPTDQIKQKPSQTIKQNTNPTTTTEKTTLDTKATTQKTYDPNIERKIEWDTPTQAQIVRTTITTTDASHREPSEKVKVGQIKQIPTDTRVTITPDAGDINYHESQITSYEPTNQPEQNKTYPTSPAYRQRVTSHTPENQALYTNYAQRNYTIDQTPDYEENGIFYGYTPTNKNLYDPIYHDHNQITTQTLPIKHHFKRLNKANKKANFPWHKVAIGVAATIGAIGLIKNLTEDDDSDFFWQ